MLWLLQDSKGYLWIRTLNGLCKFDGKKFKIFTKENGLKNNSIYAIYEDSEERIWFATASSHIGYIKNDSVFYMPSSERFAKENGYGQKVFYQIVSDANSNIYVSSHGRAYKFNSSNNFSTYSLIIQNDFYLKIVNINHHILCIPDSITSVRLMDTINLKISVLGKKCILKWDENILKQGGTRIIYPCQDTAGNIYFNFNNRVFLVDKYGVSKEYIFENLVYHIFVDKLNNLWLGLNSEGLLMFPNADLNQEPKHLLLGETISGIIQDFEGGTWVSTLNKGLFYSKNLFNKNLVNSADFNYKPEMLKIIDSSLFLSDFKSYVVKLNLINQEVLAQKINIKNAKIGILDIDKYENGYLLSGRNHLYKVDNKLQILGSIFWKKKLKLSSGAYNTIITENNKILGVSKNYLTNYTTGYSYKLPSFGNDVIQFQDKIFVATKNGLLKYFEEDSNHFRIVIADENVIKLINLNQQLLVICRDGKMYFLDENFKQKKLKLIMPV